MTAEAPLVDLLMSEYRVLRRLSFDQMQDFLTDVDRRGWEDARHALRLFRADPQTGESRYDAA